MGKNELTPLEKWVFETLEDDATLVGLVAASVLPDEDAAVYHIEAPAGAVHPFILFNVQSARDVLTMGVTRKAVSGIVSVRVVGETMSTYSLSAAADRVDTLLTNPEVATVDGVTIAGCWREEPLDFPEETDDGKRYRHVGGLYRVTVVP